MTSETYSYLLSIIEHDEDCLFESYPEGETLDSLLQKRGQVKKQLAELYSYYLLNK